MNIEMWGKKPESSSLSETCLVVPDETMTTLARWVSEMTSNAGTMLPKSVEEVLVMFEEGKSVMILDFNGQPLAHAAMAFVYENAEVVEIGGMIVDPGVRRMGYAKQATLAVMKLCDEKYPGWKKMVLCNSASLPLALKLGGKIVDLDEVDLLPSEVWEACATCPNLTAAKAAGKLCCDTPVLLP